MITISIPSSFPTAAPASSNLISNNTNLDLTGRRHQFPTLTTIPCRTSFPNFPSRHEVNYGIEQSRAQPSRADQKTENLVDPRAHALLYS
jgi:hypothetical protein